MNCLRCNTLNEEAAKFCKNCGMYMAYTPSKENINSKSSDIMLIIFISISFISAIAQVVIEKLVPNWYESPTKYYRSALWIIQNLTFILIPLAISNKLLKIVGLISTLILVCYWVYNNIQYMTSTT